MTPKKKSFASLRDIWILISNWELITVNDYLKYFSTNKKHINYEFWDSYDPHQERDRTQIFLIKKHDEIDLDNLFQDIINLELKVLPQIRDRIYIINPQTNVVFMLWDSVIELSSNSDAFFKNEKELLIEVGAKRYPKYITM